MSECKTEEKTISTIAEKVEMLARTYPQFQQIVRGLIDLDEEAANHYLNRLIRDINHEKERLGLMTEEYEDVEDVTAGKESGGVKPLFAVFYNK